MLEYLLFLYYDVNVINFNVKVNRNFVSPANKF